MRLRIKQDQRGISNVIVVMLSLVILVIISANVILWSYQMNQLDWEKMQEDVSIVDVRDTWSYNPSGYSLGGSTSLVSGSVSNLKSDDNVYMVFRSYYSGTNITDFVDNYTSDVGSPADRGTHSNFTAQQYGPDSIYDTLMEEDIGGSQQANKTCTNDYQKSDRAYGEVVSGSRSDLNDWAENNYVLKETKETGAKPEYLFGWIFDFGNLDSSRTGTKIVLRYYLSDAEENWELRWNTTNSGTGTLLETLNATSMTSTGWLNIPDDSSTTLYISIVDTSAGGTGTDKIQTEIYIDALIIEETTIYANYELDLEVQWMNVDYEETNEELCVYGGTMDSENIRVDVWNGSAWENVFTDLSSGWNKVSVSSYLDSSTFTIRFKGGNETGDATQDSWDIDVTLLHVWSDEYTSEVEFTGLGNMEDWIQLNWTVDGAWTSGLVNVTLQLYNYTLDGYPTGGNGYIAYTSDDAPNTDEVKNQTITVNPTHFRNATGYWRMKAKGVKATDTQFDFKADWIEFKVGSEGTLFAFENRGSLTSHLVSLWVINSTHHQRYDIDVILNSGETLLYLHVDISLPSGQYVVKVVTERGNIVVFSE